MAPETRGQGSLFVAVCNVGAVLAEEHGDAERCGEDDHEDEHARVPDHAALLVVGLCVDEYAEADVEVDLVEQANGEVGELGLPKFKHTRLPHDLLVPVARPQRNPGQPKDDYDGHPKEQVWQKAEAHVARMDQGRVVLDRLVEDESRVALLVARSLLDQRSQAEEL